MGCAHLGYFYSCSPGLVNGYVGPGSGRQEDRTGGGQTITALHTSYYFLILREWHHQQTQ